MRDFVNTVLGPDQIFQYFDEHIAFVDRINDKALCLWGLQSIQINFDWLLVLLCSRIFM